MKKLDFSDRQLERRILSISHQFGYVGIVKENAVWLENSLSEPAFEFVKISPPNIADAQPILERYVSEYRQVQEYVVDYSQCLKLLSGIAKEVSLENIEFFKRGVTFCPRIKLPQLFQDGVAPVFFGTFGNGEIIIVRTFFSYWRRASFKRLLYTLSHYSDAILNREVDGLVSLQEWNRLEPDDFLSVGLRIVQYLFFPYVSSFSTGHGVGLMFIFIPSDPFKHERPLFPADWIDFLKSDTELGEEKGHRIETGDDLFTKSRPSIYGKYLFESPPPVDETKELMEWAIQSVSSVVTRLYDVTNFSVESSDDVIDPVYGQEYAHSFMHVLRDSASIIANDSRYRNKATTFRVADILSAMAKQSSLAKPEDEFFRELFSCTAGKPKVKNILYGTGLAPLKSLADASDKIYDNLKRAILNSIFIPGKRQASGVFVKTPSLESESITDEDEFCGHVLRALRNTQHGYFTRGDRSSRPSRFLSLIDGNTPDDFPTLALAWTLALLASPTEFLGDP